MNRPRAIRRAAALLLAPLVLFAVAYAGAAAHAHADAHAKAKAGAGAHAVQARIKHTLETRYSGLEIDSVKPAPVPGLYEIVSGDHIAYTDPTGDYLIVGKLIDTRSGRNLTGERLAALQSVDFSKLPFQHAIKIVHGKGTRRLAVFADPKCPYCQRLVQELQSVHDVTVYTFLYPLEDVHPGATAKAHQIWCASDHARAWSEWMLHRKSPKAAQAAKSGLCKGDPVAALQALGKSLHIDATPTLFLENGERVPGLASTAQLKQMLKEAAGSATPAS